MLQEYWRDGHRVGAPEGPLGHGVSICFVCADALAIYHELTSRWNQRHPAVRGHGLWVPSVRDPDGYHLEFESPTMVRVSDSRTIVGPRYTIACVFMYTELNGNGRLDLLKELLSISSISCTATRHP